MQELLKQEKVDITKYKQNLSDLTVGMGWDIQSTKKRDMIIDLVAILADEKSNFYDKDNFVYYNNPLIHKDRDDIIKFKSIKDVNNTKKFKDLQQVDISLYDIPETVSEIIFSAAIYDSKTNKCTLNDVSKLHLHLFNKDTQEELAFITIDNYFSIETCLVFGKLYRQDDYWKFENISEGYIGDLGSLFSMFYRGTTVSSLTEENIDG